jgi:hypothetical protein
MTARSPIELTVTFGPSSSLLYPRAVASATQYAATAAEIAPGTWRASFSLGADPDPYARAHRLLQLVGSWKATEVQVAGSLESLLPALSMTECARGWLRRVGSCRAPFPVGPWPKCELCPLFEAGWAAESFSFPPYFSGGADRAPDYPPEE